MLKKWQFRLKRNVPYTIHTSIIYLLQKRIRFQLKKISISKTSSPRENYNGFNVVYIGDAMNNILYTKQGDFRNMLTPIFSFNNREGPIYQ